MIRLGLIGCGGMGASHQRALEMLQGRAAIVAVADVNEEVARQAAATLGAQHAFTDYRELIDYVDAAIVVLPHHLHHQAGMELLTRGKHVMMEKPLANSEQQCVELIRTAESAGLTFMVAYCMRYNPIVLEMERLVKEETYGKCFQLSIWTEQHTQRPPGHWQHDIATLGGGQLFSHGCHYIDILLAWMGEPLEGTHLGNTMGTPWMEGEGTSNVSLKFRSGALGYHFGTWGAKGSRLRYSFHAHCMNGMIEAFIRDGKLILHQDAREEAQGREQVLKTFEPGKQVQQELFHFIECIERDERPLTDGRRALQSLRVIWRLYEAERQGVVADLRGLGLDDPIELGP